MATKPALFLDLDNFKFNTLPLHLTHINKTYGIASKPEDYVNNPSYDSVIKKYWHEDKHHLLNGNDIYIDVSKNVNASLELHESIEPMEGMCETLPRLAKKYQLWTVTARDKDSRPVVEYLLDKFVPGCITGIHFVYELLPDNTFAAVSKRDFVAQFQGEKVAFLDDSAKEILEMQSVIPSYLYDPHKVNDHLTEIERRVRDWKEIDRIFL